MPAENDAKQANGIPQRAENAPAGELFAEAVAIMARLRAPGGCPWDREQTFGSIRKYTLEETYEVLDAIEREHWADLADELGDLLLQVLFYAEMAEEAGHFGIADVIAGLNRKLVRRHPHVFGEEASAAAGNRAEGLETRRDRRGRGAAELGARSRRGSEKLGRTQFWQNRAASRQPRFRVAGDAGAERSGQDWVEGGQGWIRLAGRPAGLWKS